MRSTTITLSFLLSIIAGVSHADESVVIIQANDGRNISYLLTTKSNAPKYTIVGFPGGAGFFGARVVNGEIQFASKGNFVVRTRNLVVDDEFAMALTDATSATELMGKIVADLKTKFPKTRIYLMSTSLGTIDSANLSLSLGDQISGAIHTSSMSRLTAFPFDKVVVRQLFVHHHNDGCNQSNYGAAKYIADKFGIKLITITGGTSQGDPCQAFGHHGYAGVEKEAIDAIKAWVRQE